MATITTLNQMRDFCKLMLGAPVINVELDDTQIDQIIENECQVFSRYEYEEGNYEDYIIFHASAGVSNYSVSAVTDQNGNPITDILHTHSFEAGSFMGDLNVMFTPTHILLHQSWVEGRQFPGGPNNNGVSNMILTDYSIAMMYIKDIQNLFGKSYVVRYIPNGTLKIVPTPNQDITGVLIVYRKLEDIYLYNHPLVKKLCVAGCKKMWGSILSKYQGTLPDGLSINGDAIKSEGIEEYNKALEDIKAESQPCEFFIG